MVSNNSLYLSGEQYVCPKCEIMFRIWAFSGLSGCISMPIGTYKVETSRPKACCPKCKQEIQGLIRVNIDE